MPLGFDDAGIRPAT